MEHVYSLEYWPINTSLAEQLGVLPSILEHSQPTIGSVGFNLPHQPPRLITNFTYGMPNSVGVE